MRVALALRKIGPDAVPPLYEALADPEPSIRGWAAFTLGFAGIGGPVTPAKLAELLRDKDRDVKYRAVEACELWLKPEAWEATLSVVEAIKDKDPEIRVRAIAGLSRHRPEALSMFRPLTRVLQYDSAPEVRGAAADALGRIGPLAVHALAEALEDPNASVRCAAADAIGEIGPRAKAAGPELIELTHTKDRVVRLMAVRALRKVDAVAAVEAGVL